MGLTPEKMAEFLAAELIDDLERFTDWILKFEERWTQYGAQYQSLLTPEKRAEVEAAFKRFHDRTRRLSD